jgi:hypothetical protein
MFLQEITKIKFGIGVDQQQFELGQQVKVFANAQTGFNMVGSWIWFVVMEGSFTSPTVANSAAFKIHTGKSGSDYNLYRGNIRSSFKSTC